MRREFSVLADGRNREKNLWHRAVLFTVPVDFCTFYRVTFTPIRLKVSNCVDVGWEGPSSETQGQIVGARESLNGRENIARRNVKNGEKSSSRRSAPGSPRMGWHVKQCPKTHIILRERLFARVTVKTAVCKDLTETGSLWHPVYSPSSQVTENWK